MHAVMHDWSDDEARIILRHIADAMNKESMLLVDECGMPDINAEPRAAALDILTMSRVSGIERSISHWEQALSSADLHVVEVHSTSNGFESVIEARKRQYCSLW